MKKININKVVVTANNETVRGLEYHIIKDKKRPLAKPKEVIKGRYYFKDTELNTASWIENYWSLDGKELYPISGTGNHNLVEKQPKNIVKRTQLSLF